MNVRIENVLWQLAKFYRERLAEDHPDQPITMSVAALATFQALKDNGDAVEQVDADGNVTWKATPQLLRKTGLEPGPLVTFGPEVH